MLAHDLGQHDEVIEVVVVVFQRLLDGFAYGLQPGKVDHCVDLMLVKQLRHGRAVADIRLHKGEVLPRDLPNGLQRIRLGIYKVVHHHDLMPRVQQLHAGVAPDVSGAACDKDSHGKTSPIDFHCEKYTSLSK